MKRPWVNLLLLILLIVQAVTGYFGFANGRQTASWILWLHGIGAYALALLFFPKLGIILGVWQRARPWTGRRIGFVVALVLLVLTLVAGLLWTFQGPLYLANFSLVSLHIYLAVPLLLLMAWHAWHMRFVRRVKGAGGRRLFVGGLAAVAGGLGLWFAALQIKSLMGLRGAARRFTGSFEIGSFGPDFPVVSWIADRPPPVDVSAWRLRIEGAVDRPLSLGYPELLRMAQEQVLAELDCTGGWYTSQRWRGVTVGQLLELAGLRPSAASITFEAVTGYRRRFGLDEVHGFLLAIGTMPDREDGAPGSQQPLSHGHGAPLRLVARDRRGMEWVKWVGLIRVNETGALLQSPLPLQ